MTEDPAKTFDAQKNPLKDPAPESWEEALASSENDLYRRGRSEATQEAVRWLEDGPAKRESDVAVLVNAAAERFRELRVEIPSLSALQSAAQQALSRAGRAAIEAIESGIGSEAGERLDGLLSGRDGRSPFDFLKDPVPRVTVSNLARELLRLEQLELLVPQGPFPKAVTRHQPERFARLADLYTAPELAQLSRVRRRALLFLLCPRTAHIPPRRRG